MCHMLFHGHIAVPAPKAHWQVYFHANAISPLSPVRYFTSSLVPPMGDIVGEKVVIAKSASTEAFAEQKWLSKTLLQFSNPRADYLKYIT